MVFFINEMEIQPKKGNKVNSVSDVFLNPGKILKMKKRLLFREKIRHKNQSQVNCMLGHDILGSRDVYSSFYKKNYQ